MADKKKEEAKKKESGLDPKAMESLKASNELLSLFVRNSPVYAYIKSVTAKESRILQASDNYGKMLGSSGGDVVGKTMAELFPPQFAAKITEDDWYVVSNGRVLSVEKDMDDRTYVSVKFPFNWGDKKILAGYMFDVTDRKKAEDDVKRSLREAQRAAHVDEAAERKKLEDKLRDIESKLRDSEGKLREAEGGLREREGKLQDIEDRLREAEGGLREREEKLQASQGKLHEAEAKLRDSEDKLRGIEDKLHAGEGKLREAEGGLRGREEKLQEIEDKLREAEAKLRDSEDKLRGIEDKLHAGEDRLREAEGGLREREENLRSGEDKLKDIEEKLRDSKDKLRDGAERLREVEEKLQAGQDRLREEEEKEREDGKKEQADREQLHEAEEKLRASEGRLKEVEGKIHSGEDKLEDVEDKLRDGEDKLKRVQDRVRDNEDKLKSVKDNLRSSEDELRNIEERLSKSLGRSGEDEERIKSGRDRLREVEDKLRDGEDKLRDGEVKLREIEDKLRSEERRLRSLADSAGPVAVAGKGSIRGGGDEEMLREFHNSVRNNLSSIIALMEIERRMPGRLMERLAGKPGLTEASLTAIESRIGSMALLHERLYQSQNPLRVDSQDYLSALVSNVREQIGAPAEIECSVDASGIPLKLDAAVPVGIIVNELVTNAFRYAFPKNQPQYGAEKCEVKVSMGRTNSEYTLSVEDNGVGLPKMAILSKSSTLGLRLVRMLGVDQLGGKLTVNRTKGTRFVLKFNIKE